MAGVPVGLDFGAIMAVGQAQGVDVDLLSEALPEMEISILAAIAGEAEED